MLLDIIKDIPEAARPSEPFGPATTELIFIGSMMQYLIGEGYHSFEWEPGEIDAVQPSLTLYDKTFFGNTTLEILAAACKGVK